MRATTQRALADSATHDLSIERSNAELEELVEEFSARLERGQQPPIEEFAAAHPRHADRLRRILPTMRMLADLSRGEQSAGLAPANPLANVVDQEGTLGDFRIVREVGRGGMGVVYEAHQISLARRVALKILPFAAVLDPQHLQRFKNEALAAAHLDHPNIVEVYGVGCERGIHFYAMRFVEGQTLAALIDGLKDEVRNTKDELKTPLPSRERLGEGHVEPARLPADAQCSLRPAAGCSKLAVASLPSSAESIRPSSLELRTSAMDTSLIAALSTLRETKPRDYYRRIAELGIQVAEALDHAHQMGIVHRDIKPANLLTEIVSRPRSKDQSHRATTLDVGPWTLDPKLWITDFGLARLPTDVGMTMTGDLVGTLRYMSPEQALAKRITVDHRTDIYSLGITLYELLALQPAFNGADREEVLRQIAFEEPIALRRLKPAIPIELETIIHKTISKNPDDRYATASDLADDLRRFRTDTPIRAHPPTPIQRVVKWTHKHRPLVYSAAACLLIVFLAVAASIGWIVRDRTIRATEAKRLAMLILDKASRYEREEKWADALVAAREAEGVLIGAPGNDDLRETVREHFADLNMVAALEKAKLKGTETGRAGMFDRRLGAKEYQSAFHQYGVDVPLLDVATAAGRLRDRNILPQIVVALDNWAEQRKRVPDEDGADWKHLSAIADALDTDAWRKPFRDLWSRGDEAGLVQASASAPLDSLPPLTTCWLARCLITAKATDQAIEALRAAQRKYPGDFWLNWELAKALDKGQPQGLSESLAFYRAALAVRPTSGAVHNNVGIVLSNAGKLDEALTYFREAVRLAPEDALVHANLGSMLRDKGNRDEALSVLQEAIRLDPECTPAHNNLGIVLADKGLVDEAVREYKEAIRLDPKFATAHENLALHLLKSGKYDEAIAAAREAIRLNPDNAEVHNRLGVALVQSGRLAGSIPEFRQAVRLQPDHLGYRENLHTALTKAGHNEGLEPLLRETIDLLKKRIATNPLDPDLLKQLAGTYTSLSKLLFDSGRASAETAEMQKQALAIQEDLVDKFPKSIGYLDSLAVAQWNFANDVWTAKNYSDAINRWEKAIQIGNRIRALDANAPLTIGLDLPWVFVGMSLVTCPDRSQRDPDRALRNAQLLHQKIPGIWSHMTRGIAWVGKHDWNSAIDDFNQVKHKPDDVFEYVRLKFLSIAHYKVGNRDEHAACETAARRWLEQYLDGLNQGAKETIEAADRLYAELVPGAVDPPPKSPADEEH